jgi:hypothetical protein
MPPDPIQTPRRFESRLQALDHLRVVIRAQKRQRQRQPAALRGDAHKVEQEHEQIICVPLHRGPVAAMQDLEIDQPRAASCVIVDDIPHRRIAVRPQAIVVLVAGQRVRPFKLPRRRLHHLPPQRAFVEVIPQTFAREFLLRNLLLADRVSPETPVEHSIGAHFPSLPESCIRAELDWDFRQAKKEVREAMHDLRDPAARFDDNRPPAVPPLGQ